MTYGLKNTPASGPRQVQPTGRNPDRPLHRRRSPEPGPASTIDIFAKRRIFPRFLPGGCALPGLFWKSARLNHALVLPANNLLRKLSMLARRLFVLAVLATAICMACSDDGTTPGTPAPTRSYRMGFSAIVPTNDIWVVIAAIDMWSKRADAAIMSFELPWDSLLAGVPPAKLVDRDQKPLANYYRSKGHELWIYLDPANGLDRAGESTALVNAGRSITEPSVQQLFRRYAVAIDSIVQPEHLGLALETNLIRGIAPAPLY